MVEKVLFVCSGNLARSPTAEEIFNHSEGFEVKSAGTMGVAPNSINLSLIEWADTIFAMEEKHREYIIHKCPQAALKITVLNIEDNYSKMDPELVAIFKEKLDSYFNSRMENSHSEDTKT